MTYRFYAAGIFAFTAALVTLSVVGAPLIYVVVTGVLLIISVALCYRAVAKPMKAVANGINLLRSQDFGSRLRKIGQADADEVICLFNRMMDSLKAERLKGMEQELFLARLIEVSPAGIAVCDFDGNIVRTNPEYERMRSPQLDSAMRSLALGQTRTLRLSTSDVFRCSRLWFMDSGFRRPFLMVQKLTEDVAHAEREVFKKIVRTIGHEVNNTLGSVTSLLDTLADMLGDDGMVSDAIAGSIDSCHNLVRFVRGYAEVVKLPPPAPAPADLGREIDRLLPVLRSMASENINIDTVYVDRAIDLSLDMMLMDRAIINIVKNSIESISVRGHGTVTLRVEGHRLLITDDGPGITDEVASRLFTPFFSTKRADRGLGLMLVADILRAHNAEFSLCTDSDTGLTTFAITFP